LQNHDEFKYHQEIAKDKILFKFLETNTLSGIFLFNPVYRSDGFLHFVTPYFAHSYCELVSFLFNNESVQIQYLFRMPLLLTHNEETKWLKPLSGRIYDLVSEIEQLTPTLKYKDDERPGARYQEIYSHEKIRSLNILNKTLEHDVETYVKASLELVRICVNAENNGFRSRELVLFVLTRINGLYLNEEDKKKVKHYLAFVKPQSQLITNNSGTSGNEGRSGTANIIRVIVLIIILARVLVTCSHF
jgi:hypothetical protein